MNDKLKERQNKVRWTCRFHPYDWWHEVGCPHREWTNDELLSALITKKEFEESKLKGITLSDETKDMVFGVEEPVDYIDTSNLEITRSIKSEKEK